MNEYLPKVSVIIPTLNAGPAFHELIHSLKRQTVSLCDIQIVDSESEDGTAETARELDCQVTVISRKRFDHGGARNLGATMASGDILVFLTQDALPVSAEFIARLVAPIDGRFTAASYARQLPAPGATPTEAFARLYNYPPESSSRHISRVERRTLKTFFFSNTASAVSRACFERVGRFPFPVPTNEDMLLCARLLDAGYQIAYVAEAEVIHSHEFSLGEVFQRYFRIGTVTRQHHATLRVVRNAGEGVDFVRQQISHLQRIGHTELIPGAVVEAGVKAMAFYCGHAWRSRHRAVDAQPATVGRAQPT
jgi:glycosyltransferase involved in cell wall biosynthesis